MNMIELPEAVTLARQLNETVKGKTVSAVTAGYTEHKLVWYYGSKEGYEKQLKGKKITGAVNRGGLVEISAEDIRILCGDGVNLRYMETEKDIPKKHQLLIKFSDNTYLCGSVQMYGGLGCFKKNTLDNDYYRAAMEKPSPLSDGFKEAYFKSITAEEKVQKLSIKGLLATEQRIPGLGNGVLQDILYNAKLHPKKKTDSLTDKQVKELFKSIKTTFKEMSDKNGRNTEKDLFGLPGNYITKLSKNTVGNPCPVCKSVIEKASYMGGSIYFCPVCQEI
jgi:formamidopyrimidine-DNA glycosylase